MLKLFKIDVSRKQQGFVSILVAAMIMVILSLITIGFTRVMQNEQRQVLDRQLSRQAIYAAESGINDVHTALKNYPNLPNEKTTCDVTGQVGGQDNPAVNGGIIDSMANVAYTCVLYDKTPTELIYSISSNESKIVELKTDSSLAFKTLNIDWSSSEQTNNDVSLLPVCGASADTFPGSRAGTLPILRLDLTNTTTLNRNSLISGTDYMYLVPCSGGASTTHTFPTDTAPKGQIVQVSCFAGQDMPCRLVINGLGSATYVARIKPVYDGAKVTITGKDSADNSVGFKQAQTSIDVTARASDVIRRLRVSIPFSNIDGMPESVFQSFDGVCKVMAVDAVSVPATINDSCNP